MTVPQTGDALAPRRIVSVGAAAMQEMSVILADPNPIHLDVDAVRALGLGDRLVNQGPINLGYVIDMVRQNFPTGRLTRFEARLLSNVFEGDDVTAGGAVESAAPQADGVHIVSTVWLDVAGGTRAVQGTATVVIA